MSTVDFEAELDRLAVANGLTRAEVDTVVFNARAAWFKQKGFVAKDHLLLAQLKIALAGDALRRELAGL